METITLRNAMRIHAVFCIIVGLFCVILPHSFFVTSEEHVVQYNHTAHEYIRLYGCLTLCLGWLVERCKTITDGKLIRIFSEVFCFCYALHAVVMLRAHITAPTTHSMPVLHLGSALLFAIISLLYGSIRAFRKPKEFELPTQMRDE